MLSLFGPLHQYIVLIILETKTSGMVSEVVFLLVYKVKFLLFILRPIISQKLSFIYSVIRHYLRFWKLLNTDSTKGICSLLPLRMLSPHLEGVMMFWVIGKMMGSECAETELDALRLKKPSRPLCSHLLHEATNARAIACLYNLYKLLICLHHHNHHRTFPTLLGLAT